MEQITHIRKVRFDDLRFVAAAGEFRAVAVFFADDFTMCLLARHRGDAALARPAIRAGLLKDALRQMRQLPEYRRGRKKIVLRLQAADGIDRAA